MSSRKGTRTNSRVQSVTNTSYLAWPPVVRLESRLREYFFTVDLRAFAFFDEMNGCGLLLKAIQRGAVSVEI